MDPLSIFPCIFAVAIALVTTKMISKFTGFNPTPVRYMSIDGLRGYLAFFVFLHHSAVWYFYLRTYQWTDPASNLYAQFGQSSVALFFMITGFLFFSKLIDGKSKPVDWLQLFTSRVMRLLPIYLFAITILIIMVVYQSHFAMHDSLISILRDVGKWITFGIGGTPNINGIETWVMMSGVTWSLGYEWLFYFSLPLIGLIFFRIKPSILNLLITTSIMVYIFILVDPYLVNLYSFSGGIIASFLVRWKKFCFLASTKIGSAIALTCLILSVVFFSRIYSLTPMSLISVAFIVFACGNTLFGMLTSNVSRMLGQMAYGIYLLHGIVLFITFKFIVGFEHAAKISAIEYWLLISICTVFLILICYVVHIYIELPAMKATSKVATVVRNNYDAVRKRLFAKHTTLIP